MDLNAILNVELKNGSVHSIMRWDETIIAVKKLPDGILDNFVLSSASTVTDAVAVHFTILFKKR